MSRQYSPEDLLKIRHSPLVCKPTGMPPMEDWMGPPQEQHVQNRRQNESRNKSGGSFGTEGQARPSLLETRHSSKGSSNLPTNIVLGPPKTAFASAGALKSPRALDSPARSAFGNFASETPRTDYFNRLKVNPDKEGLKESTKQTRELDNWSGRRQNDENRGHTTHAADEQETRPQRKNQRQGDWTHDSRRNDNGRESKPSWSKDEETFGSTKLSKDETDGNLENIRTRAWRDGSHEQGRTNDRRWDRNDYKERDPEWMASEEPKEKKERHTVQDIEAWKAQMKAQTKGVENDIPKDLGHVRKESETLHMKSRLDKPLTFDSGMDSFFNLWDKPQAALVEQPQASEETVKALQAKAQAKSSRFTGFFAPSIPSTPTAVVPQAVPKTVPQTAPAIIPETSKPLPSAEESAIRSYNAIFDENPKPNDDKAGFDRMLSMLRGSVPAVHVGIPHLPIDAMHTENHRPHTVASQSPTIHSPRSQKRHGLETILGQPCPPEPPRGVINKDTEFLLNLLRKDEGLQQHLPGMNQTKATHPPNLTHRMPEELLFDERRHAEPRGVDKLNPTIGNPRMPQGRSFEHSQEGPANNSSFRENGPGILHPPGFEQNALPPGFGGINPLGARGPMPPPGFTNRGPNPAGFPPGPAHAIGNLNLGGHDRPQHLAGPAPPNFVPGHAHYPFSHHGFPGPNGMGPFPGPNGPLPLGRPPLMELFGAASQNESTNHQLSGMSMLQHPTGPPPGFQRQE